MFLKANFGCPYFKKLVLIVILIIDSSYANSEQSCVYYQCSRTEQCSLCLENESEGTAYSGSFLVEKLGKIQSSKDLIDVLQNARWSVKRTCDNSSKSSEKTIFNQPLCDKDCPCLEKTSNIMIEFIHHFNPVFIVIGFITIFGNVLVVLNEVRKLVRNSINEEEKRLYSILVLNLCIAGLLMGIYVFVFAIVYNFAIFGLPLCNALGVLSVSSGQVIVTILVMITTFRLFAIIRPFKLIRIKMVIIVLVLVWCSWLAYAIVPTAGGGRNASLFTFTNGILSCNKSNDTCTRFGSHMLLSTIEKLVMDDSNNTNYELLLLLNNILNYKSPEVITQFLRSIGYISSDQEISYLGFYSRVSACTLNLLSSKIASQVYSLVLIIYNSIAFVYILIAYIVILSNVYRGNDTSTSLCSCRKYRYNQNRHRENGKLFHRVLVIVGTNFVCLVPIIIIALNYAFVAGKTSTCTFCEYAEQRFWIPQLIFGLSPLNSLLNPYIYSYKIWQPLFSKIRNCFKLRQFFNSCFNRFHNVDNTSERIQSKTLSTEKKS